MTAPDRTPLILEPGRLSENPLAVQFEHFLVNTPRFFSVLLLENGIKEVIGMSELIRYDWPETSVGTLFEDLLADSFFNRVDRDLSDTTWPRVDIIERPDSYVLKADLPGLEKDDISIKVDSRMLTISGEKEETKRDVKRGNYYHLERGYGSFCRSFTLPSHVDDRKVEAHFKNGVLELILKKTGEVTSKAIAVKVD